MRNERRTPGSERGDGKPAAARRCGARRLFYTTWSVSSGNLLDGTNWSPAGVPSATDFAIQTSGESSIQGATFPTTLHFGEFGSVLDVIGSTLTVQFWAELLGGTGTMNVYNHSQIDVSFTGGAFAADNLTINIGPWDNYIGHLTMEQSPTRGGSAVTINGSSSTYTHLGSTALISNDVVHLNTNTIGIGSWTLGYHSSLSVDGIFKQSVLSNGGILFLDTPTLFTGSVNMTNSGAPNEEVSLLNLFATAAKYHGGTLTLDFGSQVIDRLRVASDAAFDVYQTPTGVQLVESASVYNPPDSTLLLHVASPSSHAVSG